MADAASPKALTAAAATEEAPTQPIASSPGDSEEPKSPVPVAVKRRAGETVQSEADEMAQIQEDEGSPPRKKARREVAEEVNSQDGSSDSEESADEGEVDSEEFSKETTLSQVDGQDSSPEPTTANDTPSGLRTSFATSVPKQSNPDLAMHLPITSEDRAQLINGLRDGESKTVPPVRRRGVLFKCPPVRADAIVGSSWLDALKTALHSWCEAFLEENRQKVDTGALAANILQKGFLLRISSDVVTIPSTFRTLAKRQLKSPARNPLLRKYKTEFKKKKTKGLAKKEAGAITKAEQKQQASSNAHTPEASSSKSAATQDSFPTSADTDGELEEGERVETDSEMEDGPNGSIQLTPQEELDLRQRYYPGLPADALFCLVCASLGHNAANCSEAQCKFCHNAHFTYQCPSRQRCIKCKQLGHTQASCKEKLAIAPGEGFMECAFCEGQDHQEENCTELWQTYRPKIGSTKKVKQLPIYCYCCGAQGHFGSDCGLANPKVPPCETWTTAYASMYLDSESSDLPIVDENPPPPPAEEFAPTIPGRSIKPQSHIVFEESDDDGGEGFLRPPTAAAAAAKLAKNIQIKSNINFGGAASTSTAPPPPRQQQQQSQSQPPSKRTQRRAAQQAAPPPPPRQGTRRYPVRGGKQASAGGGGGGGNSRGQQQPPLPPGPPPSNDRNSNGGGGGRGRGGFSNFARRGRNRPGNNR